MGRYSKIILLCFLIPQLNFAAGRYGATASYILDSKEPAHLHGYQLMLDYYPDNIRWRNISVHFDGGFSHFNATDARHYRDINIVSAAPVVRFNFKRCMQVYPYLGVSIGLSYLNRTHIQRRKLGIHFAFQDRISMGAFFGEAQHVSLGFTAEHYSNCHFSKHNSGITAPVVMNVGYRF